MSRLRGAAFGPATLMIKSKNEKIKRKEKEKIERRKGVFCASLAPKRIAGVKSMHQATGSPKLRKTRGGVCLMSKKARFRMGKLTKGQLPLRVGEGNTEERVDGASS
jgi:hypothetical protein